MEETEVKYKMLKENQRFKNFKELSEYLGYTKPPAGNSKKRLIKELECYCNFRKFGNEIIIKEIFDEPKEKIDKRALPRDRSSKKGKYKEDLESLVLFVLSKQKKGTELCYSYEILSEEVGLYTKNLKYEKEDKKIIEALKYEEKALLKTVLNNMEKKNIITLEKTYVGYGEKIFKGGYNSKDKYLDYIKNDIDEIYEDTREEFTINHGRGFFNDNILREEYYQEINKQVYELTDGEVEQIYKVLRITLVGKKSKIKNSEFKEKIKEFQDMRREDLKRNKEKLWNKKNYELRQRLRKEYNYELSMEFNIKSKEEIWGLIKYKYKSARKNKKDLEKIKKLIDELFS